MYAATLSLCRDNTIIPEFCYKGIEHSRKKIYSKMQEMLKQLGTISVEDTTQNYHLMQYLQSEELELLYSKKKQGNKCKQYISRYSQYHAYCRIVATFNYV